MYDYDAPLAHRSVSAWVQLQVELVRDRSTRSQFTLNRARFVSLRPTIAMSSATAQSATHRAVDAPTRAQNAQDATPKLEKDLEVLQGTDQYVASRSFPSISSL